MCWVGNVVAITSGEMIDGRGQIVQGLRGNVLEDLYHRNAKRWYPGL